jgi:DNA-binding Lrp family transcriptional regulator
MMVHYSQQNELDELDMALLRLLQADATLSNLELARRINLSPPATHARVRRLEQQGYIRGYTAILDRERVGFDLLCFVEVNLQWHSPATVHEFYKAVQTMPEVIECYLITGEADYVLKIAVPHRRHLERFLVDVLAHAPGVGRVRSSLVLSDVKHVTALPLDLLDLAQRREI